MVVLNNYFNGPRGFPTSVFKKVFPYAVHKEYVTASICTTNYEIQKTGNYG